jgi:mono/diheme cytochrome c family protein
MPSMRSAAFALLAVLAAPCSSPLGAVPDEPPIRFNRDIRPLLAENCFACHGPDPLARKAKLRLDREDGFFGERKDGPTVVKGNPDASPLYRRLVSKDPEEVMPPPDSHKELKPRDRELIRRWIAQGAAWENHWSFIKPARPGLPAVKNSAWVRNPVDRFLLARLEAAGLSPAPEADRRSLARRLSLDLVGLPPEPDRVEAFAAKGDVEAYVDELLASPRYGEHRARYWLDAARYADTHGLHFDNFRDVWPYRDWVIDAYNRNLPFDQFTIEQVAGDLLPGATKDQIVATGFHRCNITTNEGGTIAEENLALYAKDRVETTSWVWLGLTANCAVCHDHKFDPVTMRDFYSMAAFFRNTTQGALDGNVRDTAPVLVLPKPEDEKRWSALPGELAAAKKSADERRAVLRGHFDAWIPGARPDDWDALLDVAGAPRFRLPLAESAAAVADGFPLAPKASAELKWTEGARGGKALVLDGKAAMDFDGAVGDFDRTQAFTVSGWLRIDKEFKGAAAVVSRMDEDAGFRGWDLYVQDNELVLHLVHKWKDDALKVLSTGKPLKAGTWHQVAATYDGSSKAAGVKLLVDGKETKTSTEVDTLKSTAKTGAPFRVGRRSKGFALAGGALQDVRLYDRRLSAGELRRLAIEPRAKKLLAKKDRNAKENDELFDAAAAADRVLSESAARAASLEAERKTIKDRSPVAHVQEERAGSMPMANILYRGEYDKPRDKVEAAGFAALHPMPAGAPRNRLGLAQWLVSPENPLTARVTVNRIWQEIFGTGLVKSAEDFGIMGDAPSHPELLDWLACEFRDGGWDGKKLVRLLVTSAAYRQSAAAPREKVEKDPENRLLSRGPRFRMDAEMVRDSALAAAGLLSAKRGGPSVKPYQPEGVWEAVGMREGNTKIYKRDSGEALYRRSLYSFWKRMAPPASMEILNAPAREFSCVRRERTNTPLQALVTLNDPQFVEAARTLAQAALKAAADDAGRLDFAARRALSRPLREKEAAVLFRVLASLRDHYRAAPADAKALLAVGETKTDPALDAAEHAAWTLTCNQLMNLDEFLNK